MTTPTKSNPNVPWVTDDRGNVLGYTNNDGYFVPMDTTNSSNYGIVEAINSLDAFDPLGVKILTAVIRNPVSIERVAEPCSVKLNIPDGWCPSAACIRVRDPAGQYIQWQWEPERHDRTNADVSTYASTNIKCGNIWFIVNTLPAGSSIAYTIEVWPVAQSQTPIVAIAASDPDGNTHRWTHANWIIDFSSAWSWHLYSFKNSSGYDMFLGANCGIDGGYKNDTTTEYWGASIGAKSQTSTSHQEDPIDSVAFGYGVIFRKWIAVSTGATLTNMQHTGRYMAFVSSRLLLQIEHKALSAIASSPSIWWQSAIKPRESDIVSNGSVPDLYLDCDAGSNGKLMLAGRSIKYSSDADEYAVTEGKLGEWPGGTTYVQSSPSVPRLRAGAGATNYAIPQNSEKRLYWMLELTSSSITDTRVKAWNPLISMAAQSKDMSVQKARFYAACKTYALRYTTWSSADTGYALQPNVIGAWITSHILGGYDQWELAAGRLASWVTGYGVGPVDSSMGSRLFAVYKVPPDIGGGNKMPTGMEYIGRHGTAVFLIYKEAVRRDDVAVQVLAKGILQALADCCVLAEADNGSNGEVVLNYYDFPYETSPNATAEAALCIAQAVLIGCVVHNHAAVLNRMWDKLDGVTTFNNRYPYRYYTANKINSAISTQAPAYYSRIMMAVKRISQVLPNKRAICDPTFAFMTDCRSNGQIHEWRENFYFFKRGFFSTNMQFAAMLAWAAVSVSELEQAIALVEYVNSTATGTAPAAYPLDGWANPVAPVAGYSLSSMTLLMALTE